MNKFIKLNYVDTNDSDNIYDFVMNVSYISSFIDNHDDIKKSFLCTAAGAFYFDNTVEEINSMINEAEFASKDIITVECSNHFDPGVRDYYMNSDNIYLCYADSQSGMTKIVVLIPDGVPYSQETPTQILEKLYA